MTRKKTASKSQSKDEPTNAVNYNQEFLILGHLVKYNIYMLTKSIIFSALCQKVDINTATEMTNKIVVELDLDAKQKAEKSSNI